MSTPVVLKGIIRGNMIELPDRTFLPDGYEVTLHLILTREEAFTLAAGACADMTPEEIAEGEAILSEFEGRPVKIPDPDLA
jgi:hypothetical protein